jgi:two-component system OmpR family sensor kinase
MTSQQKELRIMADSVGRSLRRSETPPEEIEWAVFDLKGRVIAGNFELPSSPVKEVEQLDARDSFITDDKYNYLLRPLPPHGRDRGGGDRMFFLARLAIDSEARANLIFSSAAMAIGAFLFFMVIGFFLTRLFLKPMRNTIELLDRFIKDTTHEITTPITAILMSIESFNRENLDERNIKRLGRIGSAARTIKSDYDDLAFLLIGKKENRVLAQIDIEGLARERAEFFDPIAKSRGVSIAIAVLAHNPPIADRAEMTRIVDNLISNAIKYNRQGGLTQITIENNRLSVEDEGLGIAKKDRLKIFERFTRLDEAQGGFGLGLSIVKMLCDRAKMSVAVEDREGGGSRFVVSW